jgi:glycosyltransferase involved in cell wall biosynthesis
MQTPKVAILMATYNGERYLQEQLNSFSNQTQSNWVLWVSDDGSTDATVSIIRDFSDKVGANRVRLLSGPKQGFAANFLSMVWNPELKADIYAYSDQDDIWLNDKLERAALFLDSVPSNIPALYCSRTLYVDENNHEIKVSNPYTRPAIFNNAIVQNIASGNTMVFNHAARAVLLRLGRETNLSLHDWITYIVVSGVGGQVYFDQNPTVRYRQHLHNLIGMNVGLKALLNRVRMLFKGRYKAWNNEHVAVLLQIEDLLSESSRHIFNKYLEFRKSGPIQRLIKLNRIGVYRQTLIGNLGLTVAAIFNKI